MSNFDARAIPGRAHYDRLTTWAASVFGRMSGDELSDLQADLTRSAKDAVKSDDDDAKVRAVLAEIGFCAVIDAMADRIDSSKDAGGAK